MCGSNKKPNRMLGYIARSIGYKSKEVILESNI